MWAGSPHIPFDTTLASGIGTRRNMTLTEPGKRTVLKRVKMQVGQVKEGPRVSSSGRCSSVIREDNKERGNDSEESTTNHKKITMKRGHTT